MHEFNLCWDRWPPVPEDAAAGCRKAENMLPSQSGLAGLVRRGARAAPILVSGPALCLMGESAVVPPSAPLPNGVLGVPPALQDKEKDGQSHERRRLFVFYRKTHSSMAPRIRLRGAQM